MFEDKVDGTLIQAGPGSPEVAQCSCCCDEVRKRKRKVGRDGYTFVYYMEKGKVSSWDREGF
jgi:hypothetical protein